MNNSANPMLNLLNQSRGLSQNLNQIKQMANLIKSSKNPQLMVQQMMQNNPQVKQIMDYVKQSGGDPKTAFYKMAEEKGVNPEEIINMLK